MARRALVVDDSNTARTLLSRMLEKYDIDVDSAESAEQALEYLGHHQPDVIFMDHQMPGMDGLQAVRTIKDNPRTATIPIMMYTSQEGELYVGQARALGAVGVLPKQIKPADVSKVLYQLHLLPDRRIAEQSTFHRFDDEEAIRPAPAAKPLTDATLREQFAELRRTVVAMLDSHSERIKLDVGAMLDDALARTGTFDDRPDRGLVAPLAAVVAVASLLFAGEQAVERHALAAQLSRLQPLLAAHPTAPQHPAPAGTAAGALPPVSRAVSAPAGVSSAGVSSASGNAVAVGRSGAPLSKPIIEVVPYGEDPLGGPRLEALRQLFDRLIAQGSHGTVDIKVFPGRFCLIGNPADGFSLAPDETAYSQCDVVGSVPDDSIPQSQRVSLAFADLAAELRSASHGALDVQIETGGEGATLVAYPPVTAALTAGEWNRSGSANNRIEIRLR
jgi:CheY-like chemotaxis protein